MSDYTLAATHHNPDRQGPLAVVASVRHIDISETPPKRLEPWSDSKINLALERGVITLRQAKRLQRERDAR